MSSVFDGADHIGLARTGIDFGSAAIQTRCPRQSACKGCRAVDGPSSDSQVGTAANVACPSLSATKGQFVYLGEDEHMVAIVVIRSKGNFSVNVVIIRVIVGGMLERVAALE